MIFINFDPATTTQDFIICIIDALSHQNLMAIFETLEISIIDFMIAESPNSKPSDHGNLYKISYIFVNVAAV